MVAKQTPIGDTPKEIRNAIDKIFKKAKIKKDFYRIYIAPRGGAQWYEVTIIWDGFGAMHLSERQNWIWDQLNKIIPYSLKIKIGAIFPESVQESVVSDEIASREKSDIYV